MEPLIVNVRLWVKQQKKYLAEDTRYKIQDIRYFLNEPFPEKYGIF